MNKVRSMSMVLVLVLFCAANARAQEGKEAYSAGLQALKGGDSDFAYMYFKSFVKANPRSSRVQGALFSVAEYSFWKNNYYEAKKYLIYYIKKYPNAQERIFAIAYLLKLAEELGEKSVIEMLQKEVLSKRQMVFLFKNSKEYTYRSLSRKKHKVIYYIDRVEFYIDGKLLTKVSY